MRRFIDGNNTQYQWLRNEIQGGALKIFNDITLPNTCTPNRCRIGFEYTQASGYKMFIDRNISFSGNNEAFNALLSMGEASFNSFEQMVEFVRRLANIEICDNTSLTYTVVSPHGNRMSFVFKYEQVGSVWRAYIMNSPSYNSRPSGMHATHRLNDGRHNGKYYVCWTPEPRSLADITYISRLWANETAKYIDTGQAFN